MKTTAAKRPRSGKPANFSLIIPPEMLERLERLAKATNRSKAFYVKEALQAHLDEIEDGYLALQRLNDKNAKNISTEELRKRLGL
jgi:RHH-type transcriptional regulator, rel operon repressor / antitoxin RelB